MSIITITRNIVGKAIQSHHQHYPSLGLDEGAGIAHHDGIDLRRGHRLAVPADVELPGVDGVRYLLGAHPAVALGEDIDYRFLNLHPADSQSITTAVPDADTIIIPLSAPSIS